jgi:hypothetical protein
MQAHAGAAGAAGSIGPQGNQGVKGKWQVHAGAAGAAGSIGPQGNQGLKVMLVQLVLLVLLVALGLKVIKVLQAMQLVSNAYTKDEVDTMLIYKQSATTFDSQYFVTSAVLVNGYSSLPRVSFNTSGLNLPPLYNFSNKFQQSSTTPGTIDITLNSTNITVSDINGLSTQLAGYQPVFTLSNQLLFQGSTNPKQLKLGTVNISDITGLQNALDLKAAKDCPGFRWSSLYSMALVPFNLLFN